MGTRLKMRGQKKKIDIDDSGKSAFFLLQRQLFETDNITHEYSELKKIQKNYLEKKSFSCI